MDIKDLKSGDVLLFSPEKGSWLSEAIVFLTGADVSHTAMSYLDSADIIEETPPAVRVAQAKERFPKRTIHVMRDSRHQDFSPVTDAAAKYLNGNAPYGMANLYLVGMILIYKKFTPSGPQQRATLAILKLVVKKVLDLINEHKYPGKTPMVCSQFVFQSYQDAGADYQLTIKDGNLLKSSAGVSLLDKALDHTPNQSPDLLNSSKLLAAENHDGDSILADLKNLEGEASKELEKEILDHIHLLSKALHAIDAQVEIEEASQQKGLMLLQKQDSTFVTPADLLEHCPDLNKVGEINIP